MTGAAHTGWTPLTAPHVSPPGPLSSASSAGARSDYLSLIRGKAHGAGPFMRCLGLSAASIPYGIVVRLRNLGYDHGWLRTLSRAGAGRLRRQPDRRRHR